MTEKRDECRRIDSEIAQQAYRPGPRRLPHLHAVDSGEDHVAGAGSPPAVQHAEEEKKTGPETVCEICRRQILGSEAKLEAKCCGKRFHLACFYTAEARTECPACKKSWLHYST